jgi:hypothetical protein
MGFKIKNLFTQRSLKAYSQLLQIYIPPFAGAYLASTGMNWIIAGMAGIGTSFLLITLPIGLLTGFKAGIKAFKDEEPSYVIAELEEAENKWN